MGNFFAPQPAWSSPREEIGSVERDQNFGENRFDARLAGLLRDGVGNFFASGENGVAQVGEFAAAVAQRLSAPLDLGLACARENSGNSAGFVAAKRATTSPVAGLTESTAAAWFAIAVE